MAKRYLTPNEAAARLGVSPDSVLRWIREGRVAAERVGVRRYRLDAAELRRLVVATGPKDSRPAAGAGDDAGAGGVAGCGPVAVRPSGCGVLVAR